MNPAVCVGLFVSVRNQLKISRQKADDIMLEQKKDDDKSASSCIFKRFFSSGGGRQAGPVITNFFIF